MSPCAVCPNDAAVQWVKDGGETVLACATHAISLDAAALVHAANCPAPAPGTKTPCCIPLAAPDPEPEPGPIVPLPASWT